MQCIGGDVFLAKRNIPQKASMLRAISVKRFTNAAFGQAIGDLALRALQQYRLANQTATCGREHATLAMLHEAQTSSKPQAQNASFAL
jgi:hypothetical protein